MEISPYVGGRSTADGHTNTIKLSSNESALGPSPKAQAAYRELAGTLHRYPDGGATDLRTALGALHGIDPEQIVCGNGSDELLQLLAQAYAGPGDEVIYCRHGFLVYPLATLAVGATPVVVPEVDYTADVDAILSRVTERTRIVFLANPNNPTGPTFPGASYAGSGAACRSTSSWWSTRPTRNSSPPATTIPASTSPGWRPTW